MRRHLLSFLLLVLLSVSAHAAPPSIKAYYIQSGALTPSELGPFSGASAACSAFYSSASHSGLSYAHISLSETAVSFNCRYKISSGGTVLTPSADNAGVIRLMCPGLVPPGLDGECEGCKAGTKKTVNLTAGYHATPSTNAKLNPLIKADSFVKQLQKDRGATMCYQGCKVGVPPGEDGDFWISQVAGTNGLYRSSVNVETNSTSQTCSEASPDAVTPTSTPPACPGTTGAVNGAVVCLPSVSDSGVDLGGEAKRGNPTAGAVPSGKTDKELGEGPGGAGNGTGTGNSSNGGGPSGGPATGSNNGAGGKGCNDGSKSPTPACSGKGTTDADGTTTKPATGKEQAACGAPGQPKCGIDETGTPGEVGGDKYDSKLDAYKNDSKDAADQIKGSGDGIYNSWVDLFAAPSLASCEGFEMPAVDGQSIGTIDPCATVEGIRTAMAYLWALSGFWLCLGWVKAANT